MKVYFDQVKIKLSKKAIAHLKMFMKHFIKTMRAHEEMDEKCWTWGLCTIKDLAYNNPQFSYGGDEDLPTKAEKEGKIYFHINKENLY